MKVRLEGKIKIKAVHDTDLKSFLEKIGLLEDMQNGQLKCNFCSCKLSSEPVNKNETLFLNA